MDFQEFVEALYKSGWVSRNDAQHEKVKLLWEELVQRGLIVRIDAISSPMNANDSVIKLRKLSRAILAEVGE